MNSMTNEDQKNKKAVLTFDGKKYFIDDLNDEIKVIVKNLQIAEAQLKMHEDTLKLISLGRNTLANDLRNKLKDN